MNEALRVLLAEDESLVANLIESELRLAGHRVLGKAFDGLQACELTKSLRPDVVLMDITMPELDGIDAAMRIQLECPTPVVILSAHATMEDLPRATEAGVGAYLVKPSQAVDIDRALRIAIARHADLMRLREANAELSRALAEIKTLSGLLHICCSCKKIRDDAGNWVSVEAYVEKRTEAQFSHSYCPECLPKYFPAYLIERLKSEEAP